VLARLSLGERNDAYSNSAVSCCCSVRNSDWYDESVVDGVVLEVDVLGATFGA